MSVTLLVVDIFLQSILYVTDGDYMEENRLRLLVVYLYWTEDSNSGNRSS